MRLDETVPIPLDTDTMGDASPQNRGPDLDLEWIDASDTERVHLLLGLVGTISQVTERLIEQVVDHEDRIHTLELQQEL